jgi:hypothetical protein
MVSCGRSFPYRFSLLPSLCHVTKVSLPRSLPPSLPTSLPHDRPVLHLELELLGGQVCVEPLGPL